MPTLVPSRGPVQIRTFVPAVAPLPGKPLLVSQCVVHERGPDVSVEVHVLGYRAGNVTVPKEHEDEIVRRLCDDTVPPVDRAAFMALLQGFEDAVLSGQASATIAAWRRCMAVYDALARDLETLAPIPRPVDGSAA